MKPAPQAEDAPAAPLPGASYLVELCSGEQRHWQSLGLGAHGEAVWRDLETGREFNEASLMYAWRIVRRVDAVSPLAGTAGGPC